MEISTQQENMLYNIYKRLLGYPINIIDVNDDILKNGSIVKVHYDDNDYDKSMVGIVKYDLQYDKYCVNMNKAINNFNNGNKKFYLIDIKEICPKSFLIEKIKDDQDDFYPKLERILPLQCEALV